MHGVIAEIVGQSPHVRLSCRLRRGRGPAESLARSASVRWSNRRAYELLRRPSAAPLLAEADVSGAGRVRSRFNLGSKSALVRSQTVSPGPRTPDSGSPRTRGSGVE